MNRREKWLQEARRLWEMAEATTPIWLRYALFAGVGSAVAVVVGWADARGDAIKIYVALVGVFVAAAASFMTGRMLSEHADRRSSRRKLSGARIRILMLEFALEEVRAKIPQEIVEGKLSDSDVDDEVASVISGPISDVGFVASEPPDFTDILDRDEDVAIQVAVLSVFRRAAVLIERSALNKDSVVQVQIVAKRLFSLNGHAWLKQEIEHLQRARHSIDAIIAGL